MKSSSVSEAVGYQPIPQAPVASTAALPIDDDDNDHEYRIPPSLVVPIDGRIRWIHFVLGSAVLLPWNALITATPYFLSRLTGSGLKSTFNSYLSTSFTAANFCFLAHATITAKQSSSSRRIFLGTSWLTLLVFLLTLSTYTALSPGVFFAFVIINGIAQASAGSYLQSAVVAIASLFGPTAMQAVMSGQAAVGVVVSAVQVLSAAASIRTARTSTAPPLEEGTAEARSAFLFFGLSTIFLVATIGAHAWLVRMPAYKTVVEPFEREKLRRRVDGHATERVGMISSGVEDATAEKGRILRVAKTNVIYEVAVAYVFVVTLAVFPPITTSILSTNPATHPLLFNAIHFLLFNVGDFAGRTLCSFPRLLIWSPRKLLSLSLARTLFIPLFLLCNVQRPSSSNSPVIPTETPFINSDMLYFLILLLFSISNGYLSSLCMMAAPSLEHNKRLGGRHADVEVAATLASFFLVGGLVIGSATSFAVRAAVCQCNPFKE